MSEKARIRPFFATDNMNTTQTGSCVLQLFLGPFNVRHAHSLFLSQVEDELKVFAKRLWIFAF